jgi:threonine dehydratase
VISFEDIVAASERLAGVANRTPVLTSRTLDELVGASVFLKAENLQRGGAFKFRGAYNKISSFDGDVAAYSSGNHAQAVALASRLLGRRAVIVMPEDAPAAKLDATRGYGAEVVTYDRYTESREEIGAALAAERGLTLVKPYDDPLVMAGQGTAALELLDDTGGVDLILTPVSGGGLAAGTATAASARGARVVGVEPEAADDTRRSLEAGERVTLPEVPRTIADGLQSLAPGELTFEVNRRLLDGIVTVSDAELVDAMRFAFDRLKVVLEPSGAAGLAALLTRRVDATARVGVILSGGNVGVERFRELTG